MLETPGFGVVFEKSLGGDGIIEVTSEDQQWKELRSLCCKY